MGNFFCSTIIASVVMLLMVAVYRWLLSNEKQPTFNRAVLLSIYGVAVFSPLLAAIKYAGGDAVAEVVAPSVAIGGLQVGGIVEESRSVVPSVVLWIYVAGVALMLGFTIVTWLRLYSIVRSGRRERVGDYTLIVTNRGGYTPFSWMKYIVISDEDYRSDSRMIILHESKHLALRHPLDLIVAQIAIIILWYNPAAYLMRDELRNVHEYQADMAVIESGTDMKSYQLLLVKKALGKKFPALANSLNHNKLKSRIEMMMKPAPSKSKNLLAASLIPALAVGIAAVNIPAVASTLDDFRNAVMVSSETATAHYQAEAIPALSVEKTDTLSGKMLIIRGKKTSDNRKLSDAATEYFVDGVKVDRIDNVDASDIASMSVHKDGPKPRVDIVLKKKDDAAEEVAKAVEIRAQYPGGDQKLMETIMANMRYPESELASEPVKKVVVVSFVVSSTGKVNNISVMRSQGEAFDNEAKRAVSMLDDFIPATIGDKPVASVYYLPITFVNEAGSKE